MVECSSGADGAFRQTAPHRWTSHNLIIPNRFGLHNFLMAQYISPNRVSHVVMRGAQMACWQSLNILLSILRIDRSTLGVTKKED